MPIEPIGPPSYIANLTDNEISARTVSTSRVASSPDVIHLNSSSPNSLQHDRENPPDYYASELEASDIPRYTALSPLTYSERQRSLEGALSSEDHALLRQRVKNTPDVSIRDSEIARLAKRLPEGEGSENAANTAHSELRAMLDDPNSRGAGSRVDEGFEALAKHLPPGDALAHDDLSNMVAGINSEQVRADRLGTLARNPPREIDAQIYAHAKKREITRSIRDRDLREDLVVTLNKNLPKGHEKEAKKDLIDILHLKN